MPSEIYWSWVLSFSVCVSIMSRCSWYPANCTVSLCATNFIICMRRGIDVSWYADKYQKYVFIRISARYNTECARLSLAGQIATVVSQYRYLGVYVLSGRAFRCSYDHNKCQYFFLQSWTLCLWGCSILNLLRTKEIVWLYDRSFMKLFRTGSVTVVTDCQKVSHFYQLLGGAVA